MINQLRTEFAERLIHLAFYIMPRGDNKLMLAAFLSEYAAKNMARILKDLGVLRQKNDN